LTASDVVDDDVDGGPGDETEEGGNGQPPDDGGKQAEGHDLTVPEALQIWTKCAINARQMRE